MCLLDTATTEIVRNIPDDLENKEVKRLMDELALKKCHFLNCARLQCQQYLHSWILICIPLLLLDFLWKQNNTF